MSIESAKAFYQKIVSDQEFRTRYQSATTNEERQQIVLNAGYKFNSEQWDQAVAEISASSNGELSEEELTSVSGGADSSLSELLKDIKERPYPIAPLYGAPGMWDK
jgi:predicted ribosomally synthesized peptide with nif11-like leader